MSYIILLVVTNKQLYIDYSIVDINKPWLLTAGDDDVLEEAKPEKKGKTRFLMRIWSWLWTRHRHDQLLDQSEAKPRRKSVELHARKKLNAKVGNEYGRKNEEVILVRHWRLNVYWGSQIRIMSSWPISSMSLCQLNTGVHLRSLGCILYSMHGILGL